MCGDQGEPEAIGLSRLPDGNGDEDRTAQGGREEARGVVCAVQAGDTVGMVLEARDAMFVTLRARVGIGFVLRMVADGGGPKGLLYRW